MDLYAVVGNPISHSKSPRIHAEFARLTGQDLEYTAIQAPLDGFAATVSEFFARGGRGLNVTVPFKEEAWRLCEVRTERAQLAGAVNTLWQTPDGKLMGDNTDGAGLVRDLSHNRQVTLAGKHLLILGAGGAVRGILKPLLDMLPASITIANRTLARAEQLAEIFDGEIPVRASTFEQLNGPFDVIINGTSASLQGDLPPLPPSILQAGITGYDMMYGSGLTIFSQWLVSHGVTQVFDGLGMLVEQAAEAFFNWRGVRPPTQPVLDLLRGG